MTLREVSEALGVKVRTVREWIKLGKIRAEKNERSKRWDVSDDEVTRLRNDNKIRKSAE